MLEDLKWKVKWNYQFFLMQWDFNLQPQTNIWTNEFKTSTHSMKTESLSNRMHAFCVFFQRQGIDLLVSHVSFAWKEKERIVNLLNSLPLCLISYKKEVSLFSTYDGNDDDWPWNLLLWHCKKGTFFFMFLSKEIST